MKKLKMVSRGSITLEEGCNKYLDIIENVKIGDTIKIIKMEGEPQYTDREGIVTHIDDAGQIHGTWGGCAIIPEVDNYIIIKRS